ncbi:MAG TPA: alpha/beta hydrolase [Solirubrobacteraceae bacterium]|nr:alpha/beta hydrolase [Solirubrobacteraceae bacterium]
MLTVTETLLELDDQPVFLRRAGDDPVPTIYLHGIPTSSFDWLGPLAQGGGIAVDLPGFGGSGKRGDLDYSLGGHVRFLNRLLDALELDRVRLCGHDWGAAVGLAWAAAQPARVQRLVIVNAIPLLGGFRWRGPRRLVRMPVVGPIAVGSAWKPILRQVSRRVSATPGPMPDAFVTSVAESFDLGTERATRLLLRGADPEDLARAGANLAAITAPALVVWGEQDPWIAPRFGSGYAAALGDATLELVPDAGHWPWIDRPEVGTRIVEYLSA